ncbi:MAG: hypothetical protein IT323_13520 [Anaerolineae bacterium]|nr:hypothetical protein [Anaerolineae bacterium]
MTDGLRFVIAALAVYRVARMIAAEDGPFDAFSRARHRFGIETQATWWQRGFACIACISFWLGLFVAALYGFGLVQPWMEWVMFGLALSCVSVVLMRKVG